MTTDAPATAASPAAARRPGLLRRLFGAQEAGLVLVILLMGAALTVFGGSKDKAFRLPVPPAATVQYEDRAGTLHTPGSILLTEVAAFIVTQDGDTTRYETADGWRFDPRTGTANATGEPSGGMLFGRRSVNRFLDPENLVLVAKDASFIAIMAVGMTAVIILAGIDLSVGSVYGLSAIVGAIALSSLASDAPGILAVPLGLLVCVAVGGACGLANGAMIVGLRVHPFVITLGALAALRGLTVVLPQAVRDTQSIGGFPASFTSGFFKLPVNLGDTTVYPVPVVIMLLVMLAGWFVLERTVLGRRVFAIGGNETAARYAGIPVGRIKIIVYTVTGMLAGLSGCVYLGYLGAAETSAGNAYELQVIAAAVIGGASLTGGRGTAVGAVLGAIVIQLISNGMIILGIDQSYNQIVMGAAIILAVVIDQAKQRLSARRG